MPLFNDTEARERLLNLPMEENNLRDVAQITRGTDKYFTKSRRVVEAKDRRDKSTTVTEEAIFIRHPGIFAPAMMTSLLHQFAKATGVKIEVDLLYHEGDPVGAGKPMAIIRGDFPSKVEWETHYLPKIGKPCVAAYNAFHMSSMMPQTAFLDMAARHNSGPAETEMMSYAASVGSLAAQKRNGAVGFIGASTDIGAKYYGQEEGKGTTPHTLIGVFADTIEAAEEYHAEYPNDPLTVLIDYEGLEVTKSIELAERFPELMEAGMLSVRIDTHGGRYLEGLDEQKSYDVLEKHCSELINGYLSDEERKFLVGKGVSAAAYWHLRDELDARGFQKLKIVPSSGFGPHKCKIMAQAGLDDENIMVGSGSFIPQITKHANATSDTISYNGTEKIKSGREYLIRQAKEKPPVITITLG